MKGQGIHLQAKDLVALQNGSRLDARDGDAIVTADRVINSSGVKAKFVHMKGIDIITDTKSQIHAEIIKLEAEKTIDNRGTLEAQEHVFMKGKDIILAETSQVKAAVAILKASESLEQKGHIDVSENLLMRAKFLKNPGEINAKHAKINADRYFLNTGSLKVKEDLTIEALASVNMGGLIEAQNLTTHAGADLNLFGTYHVKNSKVSALVGLNTGLFLPQFNSWDDLFTLSNGASAIGYLAKKITDPGFYDVCAAGYATGKALWGVGTNLSAFGAKMKEIGEDKDAGVSDLISVLCRGKDLGFSVAEFKNTVSPSKEDSKTIETSETPAEKDSKEVETPKATQDATVKTFLGIASGASSALFGSNFSRDTLLDINSGAVLGLNGHSRSLLNVNSGASLFANSHTLETVYGTNLGLLGATTLNIKALRTYSNTGPLANIVGVTGSIVAENLEIDGTIRMADQFCLQARKDARINADIKANGVAIKAQGLDLQSGRIDGKDGGVGIIADKLESASSITGNGVNIQAKDAVLKNGSHLDAQGGRATVLADQLKTEAGSGIVGKSAYIEAKSFQGEVGSSIKTTDGAYLKTEALDNRGTTQGSLAVEFTGDVKQFDSIGQVDTQGGTFGYQGLIAQQGDTSRLPTADELADGSGQWGNIANASSISFNAGKDNVNFRNKHDIPHTLNAITDGAMRCHEPIVSDKSIGLSAGGTLQHVSLHAGDILQRISGEDIVAESTVKREQSGSSYEDHLVSTDITAGGKSTAIAQRNIIQAGVKTASGEGGTHYSAGGTIIDKAVILEKHQENLHTDKNSSKLTVSTDTTAVVSQHVSKDEFIAQAGGKCLLEAPQIESKKTIIQGQNGVIITEVHDTHTQQETYKEDGGWFGTSRDVLDESSSCKSRGVMFKGDTPPEIISGKGIDATNINTDASSIILRAQETARILLGKNFDSVSHSSNSSNLLWHAEKNSISEKATFTPQPFTGVIESHAQKLVIESVRDNALSFAGRIENYEDKIINEFVDEVHMDDAHSSQGPTKALSAVIVLGVTLATAGTASSIGAGTAALLGCKAGATTALVV
jgi:hypothetical protein